MKHIITDRKICHDKAHLEATRIPVHIILDLLAAGEKIKNILKAYPQIDETDIQACIKNAATLAREEVAYESEVV